MSEPQEPQEDMTRVDTIAWGPSDPAELDKLKSRYPYDEATGTFSVKVGDDE